MSDEETFDTADAGGSEVYPLEAGAIKKGGYIMIKGHPCKVINMSTSKTGKHGHAKVHMVALDIFTGKKLEDICPSTHNMEVPNVKRKDYQLIGLDDDFLSLMDDSGETRDDLKCPDDDIGNEIRSAIADERDILATVLSAVGEECVIATKTNTAVDK